MPRVKKRVSILVNPLTLKKWDEIADSIGISRTALIHNAIKVYELFIKNQLNGDKRESIQEQLNQIKTLIEGFQKNKELLIHEKETTSTETVDQTNTKEIPDFDIIAEKIINLLKIWGTLPEATIAAHLQYPGWIIWSILKKLAAQNIVKVHNGEWSLK